MNRAARLKRSRPASAVAARRGGDLLVTEWRRRAGHVNFYATSYQRPTQLPQKSTQGSNISTLQRGETDSRSPSAGVHAPKHPQARANEPERHAIVRVNPHTRIIEAAMCKPSYHRANYPFHLLCG